MSANEELWPNCLAEAPCLAVDGAVSNSCDSFQLCGIQGRYQAEEGVFLMQTGKENSVAQSQSMRAAWNLSTHEILHHW